MKNQLKIAMLAVTIITILGIAAQDGYHYLRIDGDILRPYVHAKLLANLFSIPRICFHLLPT
jgi:hypothetical protein